MSDADAGADEKTTDKPDAQPNTKDVAAAAVTGGNARTKWMIFIIAGLLSLVVDQATKIWARESLPTQAIHGAVAKACEIPEDIVSHRCAGVEVPVFGHWWSWRLSMNPGSAFGLFSGQTSARIFLSLIAIIAIGAMVWMLKKARTDQKALHWALALVAGGAIGNLIDRVYYGVVTDFVLWKYDTHEWPVFNVADIVLVVGVGLMFIDIQKEGRREKLERQRKTKAAGLVKNLRE